MSTKIEEGHDLEDTVSLDDLDQEIVINSDSEPKGNPFKKAVAYSALVLALITAGSPDFHEEIVDLVDGISAYSFGRIEKPLQPDISDANFGQSSHLEFLTHFYKGAFGGDFYFDVFYDPETGERNISVLYSYEDHAVIRRSSYEVDIANLNAQLLQKRPNPLIHNVFEALKAGANGVSIVLSLLVGIGLAARQGDFSRATGFSKSNGKKKNKVKKQGTANSQIIGDDGELLDDAINHLSDLKEYDPEIERLIRLGKSAMNSEQ